MYFFAGNLNKTKPKHENNLIFVEVLQELLCASLYFIHINLKNNQQTNSINLRIPELLRPIKKLAHKSKLKF